MQFMMPLASHCTPHLSTMRLQLLECVCYIGDIHAVIWILYECTLYNNFSFDRHIMLSTSVRLRFLSMRECIM